jgi:two-component system, chemotaxis family, sensor kinase CheA
VSFFSEEQAAELRELFFESSQEILQELNDAGLLLEQYPADSSALARVRRAMHTLKGDSAACGFRELSELAHELEDLFTPELVAERGAVIAEIVLAAADSFHAMLGSYRGNMAPPDISELRAHIRKLVQRPESSPKHAPLRPGQEWSAEIREQILEALREGQNVFHVILRLDSSTQMPAAALQLISRAIEQCGTVLIQHPVPNASMESASQIDAAIVSSHSADRIRDRCRVPGIVSEVSLQLLTEAAVKPRDALQVLLEAEASTSPLSRSAIDSVHPDSFSEGAGPSSNAPSGALASGESFLRVEARRIDAVMNLIGELIIGKSMLQRAIGEFETRFPKDSLRIRLSDALSFQSRVLDQLQQSVTKIRMVPVDQLFRRLPRIARDVAKLQKKEIVFEMAGQTTDMDKGVLDALAEPLAHLVRNCADHGIETTEFRLASGKPVRGTIRLNAYHQGNQVVLEVSDDGQGIDREKLLKRAISSGAIKESEARQLSDEEVLNLIFHPGLSTADEVTQVSGRGVGMDVVRTVVERLKGRVTVESEPGRGTTFQLMMPLTLASIQALMFRVGKQHFAVPLDAVLEITRAEESEIHELDGYEVLRLRDQVVSLVRLGQMVKIYSDVRKTRHCVVIVGSGSRKLGLIVDSFVGEEELVIKALEDKLVATELVSGASILGDGTVVLILDIRAVVSHFSKNRVVGASA